MTYFNLQDKEEVGQIRAGIHNLSKDKLRELSFLLLEEVTRLQKLLEKDND